MELEQNVGGTDRLVRALLAVGLTLIAADALRKHSYRRLLVAGVGAIGFGFNATTCFCGLNNAFGLNTAD